MKNLLFGLIGILCFVLSMNNVNAQRYMESLDRGLVAVRTGTSTVFLSWRKFGTDADTIAFNIYRDGSKIHSLPIKDTTNFIDNSTTATSYVVVPVLGGVEQAGADTASVWSSNYLDIPLTAPAGGTTPDAVSYTYSANDCSTGDVDGDGEYEIILKWDPSNSKDNSQSGYTGNVYLDAYKLNGTRLWRIDLGINIRAGAHYTQFLVYDFDNDGKAEMVCKTAPGTKDASGSFLSNGPAASDNDASDYRNSSGYILTGEEYLTIFNGQTGAEMQTIAYEPLRGTVSDWGDSYGNRVDRFLACVAYLDGRTPSIVMCRGYYDKAVLVAFNWNGSTLSQLWKFDSDDSGNSAYAGQGNHNLSIADVDFDGRDEIVYGACAIDEYGHGLYATGLRHGDALHVSDMDPSRPGLEVWQCHEESAGYTTAGGEYRDARTGELIFGTPATGDVGRAMAADIDSRFPGFEMWSQAMSDNKIYNVNGSNVFTKSLSKNFGIWWDGDRLRELFDNITVTKWIPTNTLSTIFTATSCASNNTTKSNPCLTTDILGDWREELVERLSDNSALRIFTTTTLTTTSTYTFMHDPQYRLSIAWQNVAYNQPPHTSFYFADGYPIPKPNIIMPGSTPTTYTLSVVVNGEGTIMTNPVGSSFVAGTVVSITPVANFNNTFLNWTSDITGTANPGVITMDANKTVTAHFTNNPIYFPINTSVPGGYGTISLSPVASTYKYGKTVSITANPYAAYTLEAWGGDGSGSSNPYVVTISDTVNISATFTKLHPGSTFYEAENGNWTDAGATIDANHTGYTGTGFLNTSNATGVWFEIPITITQAGHYTMYLWYGNASSASRPLTVALDGTTLISATCASVSSWTNWQSETFSSDLSAGSHVLRFTATSSNGAANIDKIELVMDWPESVNQLQNENSMQFYANNNSLFLKYSVQENANSTITVTDITGRNILQLHQLLTNGEHVITLPLKQVASGLYLCTINVNGNIQTEKVFIGE